jgi:outer membrane receptor protein involved in Fe transport
MSIRLRRRGATCIVCLLLLIASRRSALAQPVSGQSPRTGADTAADQTKGQDDGQPPDDSVPRLFFDVSVITASRTDEEAKNTPQAVTGATREDIERAQARTPNQMLREQLGKRVLYLWDGVRLNNGALSRDRTATSTSSRGAAPSAPAPPPPASVARRRSRVRCWPRCGRRFEHRGQPRLSDRCPRH